MWKAEEFFNFLKNNPNGGTFWPRTNKRTVCYIRTFYPNKQTVVAILSEKMIFRGKDDCRVELFVCSPRGIDVREFPKPGKNQEFVKLLQESEILGLVSEDLRPAVEKFIARPDKTYYYTW
jgi:hypothetical protein